MNSSTVTFFTEKPTGYSFYYHHLLNTPVPTTVHHSESVVISLAEFMAIRFPDLTPPIHPVSTYWLINSWSQNLCEAIKNQNAYRIGECLHIKIKVDEQYGRALLDQGFYEISRDTEEWPWRLNLTPEESEIPKRKQKNVILLLMSLSTKIYDQPRIDQQALYLGIYYNNEVWTSYRINEREYPQMEDLQKAHVVIMPGSCLSIYNRHQQVEQIKKRLSLAVSLNHKLKIGGVCFGVQFISDLFGGEVKKAKKGSWKLQHIEIMRQKIKEHPFLEPLREISGYKGSQYHNDQIVKLPPNFNLIGRSSSCPSEVIVSKCNRYFGVQCHPDYTIPFMNNYLANSADHLGKPLQKPIEGVDDYQVLRKCFQRFLAE